MATTNKLLVIETKDGVVCVQEIRMEHNFYAIVVVIEELDPTDLVKNGVVVIIGHIVRGDWREGVSFQSQDTTLQKDVVFFRQQFFWTRQCAVLSVQTSEPQLDGSEDTPTHWNGLRGQKA